MSGDARVQWPGKAFSADGDDLAPPIRHLLEDLRLLETVAEEGKVTLVGGTPVSVQVITSGATSLSKWWTGAVAALGGGGAIIAGLKGLGLGNPDPLGRATFTASAAVLAAAVSIAISIIVKADVSGRATASAAQYAARAAVAMALLNSYQHGRPIPALPTPQTLASQPPGAAPDPEVSYIVKKKTNANWYAVKTFTWESDGGIAVITRHDGKISGKEIEALVPSTDWK